MNLWILIPITILVVVIAAVVIRSIRIERRLNGLQRQEDEAKAKAEQPVCDWLASARKARYDDKALVTLGPPPKGWEDFGEVPKYVALQATAKQYLDERARRNQESRILIANTYCEPDLIRKYEMLFRIDRSNIPNTKDRQWVEQQKVKLTPAYAQALLENARSGDRNSFVRLNHLTMLGKYGGSVYHYRCDEPYPVPEDWNDLVTLHYESPELHDFRKISTDITTNEVRLLAARAIKNRSLRDAKIALAFCALERKLEDHNRTRQIYWPWREAIGDTRLAELATMVVTIHAERQLFAK